MTNFSITFLDVNDNINWEGGVISTAGEVEIRSITDTTANVPTVAATNTESEMSKFLSKKKSIHSNKKRTTNKISSKHSYHSYDTQASSLLPCDKNVYSSNYKPEKSSSTPLHFDQTPSISSAITSFAEGSWSAMETYPSPIRSVQQFNLLNASLGQSSSNSRSPKYSHSRTKTPVHTNSVSNSPLNFAAVTSPVIESTTVSQAYVDSAIVSQSNIPIGAMTLAIMNSDGTLVAVPNTCVSAETMQNVVPNDIANDFINEMACQNTVSNHPQMCQPNSNSNAIYTRGDSTTNVSSVPASVLNTSPCVSHQHDIKVARSSPALSICNDVSSVKAADTRSPYLSILAPADKAMVSDVKTSSNVKSLSSAVKTAFSDVKTSSSDVKTSSSDVNTSSSDVKTASSGLKRALSGVKTSSLAVKTSSSAVKTSSSAVKTSSSAVETSSDIDTSFSTVKTSSSAVKTSSSAVKTSSSAVKTSSSAVKKSSSALKTSSSAVKTSSSSVKTSSSAVKTSSSAVKPSSSAVKPSSFVKASSTFEISSTAKASSSVLQTSSVPAIKTTSSTIVEATVPAVKTSIPAVIASDAAASILSTKAIGTSAPIADTSVSALRKSMLVTNNSSMAAAATSVSASLVTPRFAVATPNSSTSLSTNKKVVQRKVLVLKNTNMRSATTNNMISSLSNVRNMQYPLTLSTMPPNQGKPPSKVINSAKLFSKILGATTVTASTPVQSSVLYSASGFPSLTTTTDLTGPSSVSKPTTIINKTKETGGSGLMNHLSESLTLLTDQAKSSSVDPDTKSAQILVANICKLIGTANPTVLQKFCKTVSDGEFTM